MVAAMQSARFIPFAFIFLGSALRTFAQTTAAQDLLVKVIEADSKNRELMVNYLFREDVHVTYQCETGRKGLDQSRTYEVILLEGEPYFQLAEENGVPISDKKKLEEDQKMRKVADARRARRKRGERPQTQSGYTSYRFEHLASFHNARYAGEQQWNGRHVFVLETKPKPGVTGTEKEDLILVHSRTKIWVDAETRMPLKAEVHMDEKVANWPKGMVLEVDSQPLDEGWIAKRVYSLRPLTGVTAKLLKCNSVEVEQMFSKYRKFEAESKFYPGDVVPDK
jgi:hypothetical protein